jgi:hypothetical protein
MVALPSAFVASTSAVTSSIFAAVPTSVAQGSIQELIINTLNIPIHLTDHGKCDIRMAFTKYLACIDAIKTLPKMCQSGTWTHKVPSNDDVIEVFTSKSAYFKNHKKVFPMVSSYPAMEKWLLNADDAPPDHDVWGYKKQTFDNLKGILHACHEPQLPTKAKGKGGRSDGSSLEIEVVGKGKGKEVHRNV